MKKNILLIGFLVLIVACNMATPTIEAESTLTVDASLSTPVPATATLTFTPLPTNTGTPIPSRYFTDEFDSASPFWEFLQTGGSGTATSIFENGLLRIDIPSADTWYVGIHNANTYFDVVVHAKISADTTGSVGLICRYDESIGWYEFNVDSSGAYSVLLGQWLAPGIAKYIPVVSDVSNHLQPGNVNAEVGLFCEENILSLYVNEILLRRLDVTNYGLTEGNIGIAAASYRDAPLNILFEWIKVGEE